MKPEEFQAEPAPPPPRASKIVRLLIAACAVLGLVQAFASRPVVAQPTLFDERRFKLYATNLADRGFFGDEAGKWPATQELRSVGYQAQLPPGYVFFLTTIKKVFGSFGRARVLQALMAGATVWFAAQISLRLFGPIAGVTAAVLLLATGILATYSRLFLSETLAAFTLTLAIWLLVVAFEDRSAVLMIAAGLAFGVAALVRPQSLLLVFPLGVWALLAWGDRRAGAVAAAALVAAFVVVLIPWTARNYARLHAVVPVSTMTWANLFLVNNPQATGFFRLPERFVGEAEVRRIRSLEELGQEAAWRAHVTGYWKRHPGDATRGWLRNGRVFVTREDKVLTLHEGIAGNRWPRLDDRILLILAGIGSLAAIGSRIFTRIACPPVIVVLYSMGFFCFFLPEARYRVPMVPMVAVMAAAIPASAQALAVRVRGREGAS